MNQIVTAAVSVVQVASNLGGMPWLGTAASLVSAIQDCCKRVVVHKQECQLLSEKTAVLLNALYSQVSNLESEEMREAADEVTAVLEKIYQRVNRWTQYGRVQAFLKDGKIEDGIRQSHSELETAIVKFSVTADMRLSNGQAQILQIIGQNQDEWHASTERKQEELLVLLKQILQNQQDLTFAAKLQNHGMPAAERIMELGQTYLSERPSDGHMAEREEIQRGLAELQRLTNIPPTIKRLDGEVKRLGDIAAEKGGHSQVWRGLWLNEKRVALKVLQGVSATERAQVRFENEIRIWAKLHHPNVQPLYGILSDMGPFIYTVSPWQDNGSLLDYVRNNSTAANRPYLLEGASQGLAYLHSEGIVHGNVRCANILVTSDGAACICDFGMSKVIGEITDTPPSATLTTAGSTRWLAPELIFDDANVLPTFACDTWSFSMSMLECFTLRPPWEDVKRDAHVIQVMEKKTKHPTRPQGPFAPSDEIWQLMVECWDWVPERRPTMGDVADRLRSYGPGANDLMDVDDIL